MAEIKWIKLSTSLFDDECINIIETMPEGDTILAIWLKLLIQAGKTNDNGLVYFKKNIPFTEDILSTVFRRPLNIIRLALETFKRFGMIEIINSNEILISNWEKHQNIAGMDRIKELRKLRNKRYQEKIKLIEHNKTSYKTYNKTQLDTLDIDIDIDIDKNKKDIYYNSDFLINLYNEKTNYCNKTSLTNINRKIAQNFISNNPDISEEQLEKAILAADNLKKSNDKLQISFNWLFRLENGFYNNFQKMLDSDVEVKKSKSYKL
jgi:predicted phage replisome organizer